MIHKCSSIHEFVSSLVKTVKGKWSKRYVLYMTEIKNGIKILLDAAS